jgi:hypothetical protein
MSSKPNGYAAIKKPRPWPGLFYQYRSVNLFGFGFYSLGFLFELLASLLASAFDFGTGFVSTGLDFLASFLGYVASRISSVVERLANVGFAGLGYYFLRAVVTYFHFGFGGLSKRSSSECAGSEEQNCVFHD